MNTNYSFSENELSIAAEKSCSSMLSGLSSCDEKISFTEDFLERMDLLISSIRQKQRRRRQMTQFAAVFIAAILVVFTWLTVDVQARSRVIEWIKSYGSKVINYEFTGNNEDITMDIPEFELSWIPDGYLLNSETHTSVFHTYIYENDADGFVFAYHKTDDSDSSAIFSSNNLLHKQLTINNMDAELVYSGDPADSSVLTWFDAENSIVFEINSTLPPETIINIARGVKQK
jgi:hypothetical protein